MLERLVQNPFLSSVESGEEGRRWLGREYLGPLIIICNQRFLECFLRSKIEVAAVIWNVDVVLEIACNTVTRL